MGGLVAREFVSRWRHPVEGPALVQGAPIAGVVLAGTPNHGSEWARLRIWLELRDQFASMTERQFSPFSALRDGTGEAKIDLRPDSDFLRALNARPWPASVPVLSIAGRLLAQPEVPDALSKSSSSAQAHAQAIVEQLPAELHAQAKAGWTSLGDQLGDGAVSLGSARLPSMAPPVIVDASHRTMLRKLFPGDPEPPAIAPIMGALRRWSGSEAR